MNSALFRKELRDLRLWGILAALVGLLDVMDMLLSQADMQPLAITFAEVTDSGAVLFWIMAFAIGTGLTTREYDDGTLAFLDGLPVSRTRVFLMKCAVTTGLVLLAPTVRVLTACIMHFLSHGSLDTALHGEILLQVFGLQALLLFNGVVLGAALGRLRSLTWAAAGALAVGAILFARQVPRAQLLDPTTLLDAELTSSGLAIDMELVLVQVLLTLAMLAIAWHGFVRAGQSRLATLSSRPVVGAVVAAATIGIIGVVVVVLVTQEIDSQVANDFGDEPYFYPSPPAQTLTGHYRFSYLSENAERALALAKQADGIFEEVHRLVGVEPGDTIDVDTSGSERNTHGTAYFSRIRMELNEEAVAVLAHETTHVVAQRLAGDTKDWLWREATVLNEGMADWVMQKFDSKLHDEEASMFVLAAMHGRRELLIDELVDEERLARSRDENIKYPAGKALIDAMVKTYGADSVPRLLRAFADPRLPSDLRGLQLWQAAFQLAEMNIGAVIDEFYREVKAYGALHVDRIAKLPRPRMRVVTDGKRTGVLIVVDDAIEYGQGLRVRFKPEPDSARDLIEQEGAWPHEPIWRDDYQIAGGRICAQVGIWLPGNQVLFEPWTCLPTRGAVQWTPPERIEDAAPASADDKL